MGEKKNECLDLIDCTMELPMSTRKFDATNGTDAFKNVPDMFCRAPDAENRVQGPGTGK